MADFQLKSLSFFQEVSPLAQGGSCKNFDRNARVISLGLKLMKMSFFWVFLNGHHFFGFEKIAVLFCSLKICVIFFFELPNYCKIKKKLTPVA